MDLDDEEPKFSGPKRIIPKKISPIGAVSFVAKEVRAEVSSKAVQEDKISEEQRVVESIKRRGEFIQGKGRDRSRSKDSEAQKHESHLDDAEIKAIKAQYVGGAVKREVRKGLRIGDGTNHAIVKFDWDPSEDTSADIHGLYKDRTDYIPLFGKGIIGGVDHVEQDKRVEHTMRQSRISRQSEGLGSEDATTVAQSTDLPSKSRKNRFGLMGEKEPVETKPLDKMTDRDWKIFRENNDIRVVSGKPSPPIRSFEEAGLHPKLLENIKRMGFKKPTPIQLQSITLGICRKDLIGLAPTGSGKSAAFLIPLVEYLLPLKPQTTVDADEGPHAIVLSPTRELAMQIQHEFERLANGLGLFSALLIGGRELGDQEDRLITGVDVVFGTPGRVGEMLEKKIMLLNRTNYVVVDEADLMIDLGLDESLNQILSEIPKSNLKSLIPEVASEQEVLAAKRNAPFRTTHLFSATMPPVLKLLCQQYVRNCCFISIGEPGEGNKNITHQVVLTSPESKRTHLQKWVQSSTDQTIIFCNTQISVESVGRFLQVEGYSVQQYHGGKSQDERETAIERFKLNKFKILVATDLAGRGLDIEGVRLVINYDGPKSIETYVHRAGRTGRAGRKGTAVTFLTPADEGLFYDLVVYLKKNDQQVPEELESHPAALIRQPLKSGEHSSGGDKPEQRQGNPQASRVFEGGLVMGGSHY